jgi:OTU domain-containing protein 6
VEPTGHGGKPSKAQLKKQRKQAREKQERDDLAEANAKAGDRDPKAEELAQLSAQLAPLGLRVLEVPSDGNCLFHALSKQLNGLSFSGLRARAADYMRGHLSDELPKLPE